MEHWDLPECDSRIQEKMFNKISPARKSVDCAFGILVSKFCVWGTAQLQTKNGWHHKRCKCLAQLHPTSQWRVVNSTYRTRADYCIQLTPSASTTDSRTDNQQQPRNRESGFVNTFKIQNATESLLCAYIMLLNNICNQLIMYLRKEINSRNLYNNSVCLY